jgi:hypothetical protein
MGDLGYETMQDQVELPPDSPVYKFVVQLSATRREPGTDDEWLSEYADILRREFEAIVRAQFPDAEVTAVFGRGSLLAFVLVSLSQGLIGNAAWVAATRLFQNLARAMARRLPSSVMVSGDLYFPTHAAPPLARLTRVVPGRSRMRLSDAILAGIVAAQTLLIIFVLVWLLVTD